ncbi:MAG: hypothetical protein JWP83_6151 [Mycobacterium sp.]|jgi:hypothetical protein|nr:hypothetical protein [Mycobacterium sp.]
MPDLASRLTSSVQLTTDGLSTYVNAVDTAYVDAVLPEVHRVCTFMFGNADDTVIQTPPTD